jgi:hypothetical protein
VIFKSLHKKGKNTTKLSGEARKLYYTIVYYFRTIIISTVRFSLTSEGFILKMADNFGEIIIDYFIVLNQFSNSDSLKGKDFNLETFEIPKSKEQ